MQCDNRRKQWEKLWHLIELGEFFSGLGFSVRFNWDDWALVPSHNHTAIPSSFMTLVSKTGSLFSSFNSSREMSIALELLNCFFCQIYSSFGTMPTNVLCPRKQFMAQAKLYTDILSNVAASDLTIFKKPSLFKLFHLLWRTERGSSLASSRPSLWKSL